MKSLKSLIYLIYGGFQYIFTKRNSEESYQAYVKLYSITNGFSSRLFHQFHKVLESLNIFKKKQINISDNLNLNNKIVFNENLNSVLNTINRDSYYKFSSLLKNEKCELILNFINNLNRYGNKNINKVTNLKNKEKDISYINFHEKDLIKCPEIQELTLNKLFLNICRKYFGSEPILTNIGIAVTYPTQEPKTEYAQLYHFDLDRIRWLKFFVYLSDVKENDGPHCFIKGTHKAFSKPYELVKKGYKRIEDKELFKYLNKDDEQILLGPKGTVFVGDSSAFHKGLNPIKKKRIMLQLEYSNSLFGSKYEKIELSNYENLSMKKQELLRYKLFSRFY